MYTLAYIYVGLLYPCLQMYKNLRQTLKMPINSNTDLVLILYVKEKAPKRKRKYYKRVTAPLLFSHFGLCKHISNQLNHLLFCGISLFNFVMNSRCIREKDFHLDSFIIFVFAIF